MTIDLKGGFGKVIGVMYISESNKKFNSEAAYADMKKRGSVKRAMDMSSKLDIKAEHAEQTAKAYKNSLVHDERRLEEVRAAGDHETLKSMQAKFSALEQMQLGKRYVLLPAVKSPLLHYHPTSHRTSPDHLPALNVQH